MSRDCGKWMLAPGSSCLETAPSAVGSVAADRCLATATYSGELGPVENVLLLSALLLTM